MKYKLPLYLLMIMLLIYFIVKYILLQDEIMLFYGLLSFSLSTFISILIYIILFYDFRLKLRYVSLDEVSEETKNKILKEVQQEKVEEEKNKNNKKFLQLFINKQIYCLALLEFIIIIHFFIHDISLLNNVLIYTFPAFFALIISIYNLIKHIKKLF